MSEASVLDKSAAEIFKATGKPPAWINCRFATFNPQGVNKCAYCGEPPRGSDYTFPIRLFEGMPREILHNTIFLRILACSDCINAVRERRHATFGERRREIRTELTGKQQKQTDKMRRRLAALVAPSAAGITDEMPLCYWRVGAGWRRTTPDEIGA